MIVLAVYVGGAVALLAESVVQWLHGTERGETLDEALSAACGWPLMAALATIEIVLWVAWKISQKIGGGK